MGGRAGICPLPRDIKRVFLALKPGFNSESSVDLISLGAEGTGGLYVGLHRER